MARLPKSPHLKVVITREIIESAKTRDSSHCMVAEAVKSAFPSASYVSVDLQTIRMSDPSKGLRYTYLTPRVAQIGLIKFDQGDNGIEPFEFLLRRGQVTRSGKTKPGIGLSEQQLLQRKTAAESAQKKRNGRTILTNRGDGNSVPDRIGGKPPPTTPFARRRAFGLRALER